MTTKHEPARAEVGAGWRMGRSALAVLAVAAATVAAPGGARAVTPADFRSQTARDLLALCGGDDESALTFCYGYMTGAGALHGTLVNAGAIKPLACGADNVTLDQVRTVFKDWGAKNPQKLGESAIDGLAEAAASKWPCPTK